MLCFATSQIVYMAAPIPSTIPASVKIGLVCSQLSSSRPPPTPRITEIPNRSPRSKATPQWGGGASLSSPWSGPIAGSATVAPARSSADEEPDTDGCDQASDRQTDENQQRRGAEYPIQDEACDRCSHDRDHHDQGYQAQDLDEPGRGQLWHLQFDSERSDGASIAEPDRA